MKYILASFLFLLATVGLVAAPHPHNGGGNGGHNNHHNNINHNNPHFKKQGVSKHSWGYSYKGQKWNHWSKTHYWYKKYGCYCNYDPYTYCYYYWCVPDTCWYPVTYCPYNTYTWDDSDAPPQS